MDNPPSIKYLFEPRSVAIIGASHDRDKIGYKIVENILASRYPGKIYPINPKGGTILGLPVHKNIQDIKDDIDLATVAVPAQFVFESIKACPERKVKFLSIITSGFSEIGKTKEEKEIVNFANNHNIRILGPNVFGIYSSRTPINATFGAKHIKKGNVAIITQSGALGIALIGKTETEGIGLSSVVSIGNKSDIEEVDVLEYLITNKETKAILAYIEGVKDGQRFIEVMKKVTAKKPVVVIKAGRSKKGAMAAASHTGSLAGSDTLFSDILNQCGAFRAETLQEAINWVKFLSNAPILKGENTIIITNGGGIGVLATDACEKYGIKLYGKTRVMEKAFLEVVPSFGSFKNPIDITGQATIEDYNKTLLAAINNKDIHSIICLGCETAVFDAGKLSNLAEETFNKAKKDKPIVFSFVGGKKVKESIFYLKNRNIPIYPETYEAVSCLKTAYTNYYNLKSKKQKPARTTIDIKTIKRIVRQAREEKRNFLLPSEAQKIMIAADILFPKSYLAQNPQEAVVYADKIGYPIVMKVVSKDIIHKTDAGGVALNLKNPSEVTQAYQLIINNCRKNKPEAKIEGIEINEMIKGGLETIVGARRDETFGPIVVFGLGGIFVEILKDISFRSFPLTSEDANKMIKQIKSYPLLTAVRGEKNKDIEKIIDVIIKLGTIIQECREINDIEINPLIVFEKGKDTKALDIRILLSN